jgi:Tat protein translocase TatB subunit
VFGSIGGSEVILLFILALLIFGPRKLPEIGRTLGKAMADFRRATNDFKANLEREVQLDSLKDATRVIESTQRPDVLARGAVLDLVAAVGAPAPPAPVTPEKPAEPELPATSESTATTDGGTDSIH